MFLTRSTDGSAAMTSFTVAKSEALRSLHLEAGMERVGVEVGREVLLALRGARIAEALERLVLGDVGDIGDLGQGRDAVLERLHVRHRRRVAAGRPRPRPSARRTAGRRGARSGR